MVRTAWAGGTLEVERLLLLVNKLISEAATPLSPAARIARVHTVPDHRPHLSHQAHV